MLFWEEGLGDKIISWKKMKLLLWWIQHVCTRLTLVVNIIRRKQELLREALMADARHGRCGSQKWIRRQNCCSSIVSSKCSRTLMVMFSFIGCDHHWWVLKWSLYAFLHCALLTGASVIASAKYTILKQPMEILIISMDLWYI